ncbi:adenylate/guanylate cyclase domain-containing protein [Gilvimarinus agarilyticus]|uniref:adenylate/guanylate cyclase domain-containing protein n=1 Tax=Gilvimarinus agarilyticus TaxID=679259 RepID=UPI0005A28D42|nr:adenylate/guanylate cyclase domain-containing protein [Gilvimarinus agarilyticus]
MTKAALPDAENSESILQQYYFRTLICFAAGGTLAAMMDWNNINWVYVGAIIYMLIYAYASFTYTKQLPPEAVPKATRILSYADAALIGVVLNLINFSLLPCILFLAMIQFNALLTGGLRRWLEDNAAMATGVVISMLIHRPQWIFHSNIQISAVSLIGIITYFLAYALYMHQKFHKLKLSNTKLLNEQKWHKIRAYKLSRYLAPAVWQAVNQGRDETLQAERKKVTVFFSDIKNFSQLSEEMEAEALTELLNQYLTEMTKIVTHFGGTIDKFMGDAVMVLYGDSGSKGVKDDCLRCVSMAIAMKKRMKSLQQEWHNQGIKKPLQIRMGINTGYCTVGTFGTSSHLDYTVLGTHVNLASRLESAAEPDEILISHETWSLVKDSVLCRDKGDITVKGFSAPVKVYQVAGLRKDMGRNQTYFEDRAEGFSMYLDLEKVRNYDKEQVLTALKKAAEKLKDKVIV